MNGFHPIYHGTSNLPGSRIDVDMRLPASLGDMDAEDLLDLLSAPPEFLERTAPVRLHIGEDTIRGRNCTDVIVHSYRHYGRMWNRLSKFLRGVHRTDYREKGMIPFTSICIDPDTFQRILDSDYDGGENTYESLMQLFSQGVIAPCATVPFGAMLPRLDSDFERRLLVRMGLRFYEPILRDYHDFMARVHQESQFVVSFWLPEGACSAGVLQILSQEFVRFCNEAQIDDGHLVLLLDRSQALGDENESLMKTWNVVAADPECPPISVVFRDKTFSDWASYGCPSVKKLIDRTIAKVDSRLNGENINYGWGHFEDLEALAHSNKSIAQFEQKILKLTELGYLPLSPDVFVRRKLNGKFRKAANEPHTVALRELSAAGDWEDEESLGRWLGLSQNGRGPHAASARSYKRLTKDGEVEEVGSQCWKIAYNAMRREVMRFVRGDEQTFRGGVIEILRGMLPPRMEADQASQAIERFLEQYSLVYWREHFLQHESSEAEVSIGEILCSTLFKGRRQKPTAQECAVAGTAARALFFALDGHRACDTRQINFDQRAVYQNAAMLTLGLCSLIYVYRWTGNSTAEQAAFAVLKSQLLEFENVYDRHGLQEYGVSREEWLAAIGSHVENSNLNVAERAARRVAARHLRPLGYHSEFAAGDEQLTTNVGHLWDCEIHSGSYQWENHRFSGVLEE